MFFNIFLGLAMMGVGLLMLKFWQNIYNFTGALDFVERWVRAGTPAFIRLVGIILCIVGMGMIFGFWGWLTQPITDGVKSVFGGGIRQ